MGNFPISSSTDTSPLIPDLYHAQKVYIFKALEQDAFPRFLRAKAFGNLTPLGSFVRLIAGLLVLWGGFVLGFSFIFLDWKPRLDRLWVGHPPLPLLEAADILKGNPTLLHGVKPTTLSILLSIASLGNITSVRDYTIPIDQG
jgi:hypothetical protein